MTDNHRNVEIVRIKMVLYISPFFSLSVCLSLCVKNWNDCLHDWLSKRCNDDGDNNNNNNVINALIMRWISLWWRTVFRVLYMKTTKWRKKLFLSVSYYPLLLFLPVSLSRVVCMYAHERNLILMFLHIYRNYKTALINCLIVLIIFVCGIFVFIYVCSIGRTGC